MNSSERRAQTPERILDASERLFSERGYSATSVRNITTEARCNVAAVNYHFGGKDKLYREMFRRRLRTLRDRRIASIRDALPAAGNPASLEEFLRAFAREFIEPLVAAPDAPGQPDDSVGFTLITRELVDRHLPHEFIKEMFEPVETAWSEALARFCPGLDEESARLCMHSMVGQLVHVVHLQRHAGRVEACALPHILEHIVGYSAAGIRSFLPPAPSEATR
jgi:AcrR family transcriptional regulator